MSASESEEMSEPEEEIEPQKEEVSSPDSSEAEEDVDEESDEIYKEADLEFARFIIQMRLAFNNIQEVHYSALRYLKIFYKKFRAFKSSNLYKIIREEMHDFEAGHQFTSKTEVLERSINVRRIFIQNLFSEVENE